MTIHFPKVAASRFGAVLRGAVADSQKTILEVVFLEGAEYKNFKVELQVPGVHNEKQMADVVRDMLVASLTTKFPNENWRSRDVLVYGF
jgi:hypothetical protein